ALLPACQRQRSDLLGQWCAARLARGTHRVARALQGCEQRMLQAGLAGTFDALERDEAAAVHGAAGGDTASEAAIATSASSSAIWFHASVSERTRRRSRYRDTARLCSASVAEKKWPPLPSPMATKKIASVCSGFSAAKIASRPGSAIGVGGRPARVEVFQGESRVRSLRRILPS